MGATNRALSIGSIWLTAWMVSQWKSTSRSHSHYHSVRLQSLLTHSQTLIFVKDLQGRFLEVSEQFLALTGVPAEEVIGKTDHDFFPHDLADLYREHDGQVVKAGEAMNFEEPALQSDDVRHYVVRKFPLRAVVSADVISPKITELKSPLNTDHNVPSPISQTEEGRMLRREDFMVIHALAQRGLFLCDIAKQVGVHPRTVRRALDRGGVPVARTSRRGSRLDPYRADIDRLLAEDVWNAVVIFRELQAKGYTGRLSILRTTSGRSGRCESDGRRSGLKRLRDDSCRVIGASSGRGLRAPRPRST